MILKVIMDVVMMMMMIRRIKFLIILLVVGFSSYYLGKYNSKIQYENQMRDYTKNIENVYYKSIEMKMKYNELKNELKTKMNENKKGE